MVEPIKKNIHVWTIQYGKKNYQAYRIQNFFSGNSHLEWKCVDCTVIRDGDSIVVENRFTEPSDFELSTNMYLRESQNVRFTVELIDYVADLVQDNSLARTTLEAYIDYGNDLHSQKSDIACIKDCINGIFVGNIDVRNSNLKSDSYKLVVIIHAFTQDKFKVNLVSIGDLVLASEIFEDSKGRSFRKYDSGSSRTVWLVLS